MQTAAVLPITQILSDLPGPIVYPEESSDWPRFSTTEATWVPLYELHSKRMGLPEVKKVGSVDGYFLEIYTPSSFLQSWGESDYFNQRANFSNLGLGEVEFLPRGVVEFLKKSGTSIFMEGVNLPENINKAEFALTVISSSIAACLPVFNKMRSKTPKFESKTKLVKKSALGSFAQLAYIFWALSSVFSKAAAIPAETVRKQGILPSKTQNVLYELIAKTSHLHPEDFTVFFRNIMAVRKLRVISNELKKDLWEKPTIAYQFGAGHAGMTDLLKLEGDITFSILSLYPIGLLKQVVEHNGGVDAFSSIVQLKFNKVTGEYEKLLILDSELRDFLNTRFKSFDSFPKSI